MNIEIEQEPLKPLEAAAIEELETAHAAIFCDYIAASKCMEWLRHPGGRGAIERRAGMEVALKQISAATRHVRTLRTLVHLLNAQTLMFKLTLESKRKGVTTIKEKNMEKNMEKNAVPNEIHEAKIHFGLFKESLLI
jgi:hypothetical protein